MCLIDPVRINNREEDITVYKNLIRWSDGSFSSYYYMGCEWKIGEVNVAGDKVPETAIKLDTTGFPHTVMGRGVFHSFRNRSDAERRAMKDNDSNEVANVEVVVAECVIPVDSKYVYLGAYCQTDDCYASEKLKVVRILEKESEV